MVTLNMYHLEVRFVNPVVVYVKLLWSNAASSTKGQEKFVFYAGILYSPSPRYGLNELVTSLSLLCEREETERNY